MLTPLSCSGRPPLRPIPSDCAIAADWMTEFLHTHDLAGLILEHGSPINLLNTEPMRNRIAAFEQLAAARSIDLLIHFARKANKCEEFVVTANQAGIGVDVASETELTRTLETGTNPTKIICTAAIKSQSLIDRCIAAGVTIVIDNDDEWQLTKSRSETLAKTADVAMRLGGFRHEESKLPTRFGFDIDQDHSWMSSPQQGDPQIVGLQFHLDGPDLNQRISAIKQTLDCVKRQREFGHKIQFIDIGGGIPIKRHQNDESLVGSDWLASLLDSRIDRDRLSTHLHQSNLSLRCEPGRSLLDECGMTIARVEFRKQVADGEWLIGLAMNHTQCNPTHGGELSDTLLLRQSSRIDESSEPITGRFVGGQCTEHDFISARHFKFPEGIRRDDLVVFINTAAYQMHFCETGSHGSPLAKNLFYDQAAKR